jgi:hypothetical protein
MECADFQWVGVNLNLTVDVSFDKRPSSVIKEFLTQFFFLQKCKTGFLFLFSGGQLVHLVVNSLAEKVAAET